MHAAEHQQTDHPTLKSGEPDWQSLYSNGRGTGLRVLDEVGRRVAVAWGEDVRWLRCSDLASAAAMLVPPVSPITLARTASGRVAHT